ncbi:hypothetical protein L6R52_35855, partial [Myxococcota bacterium]|nr:hypothetical protein [Myxococcota bacterium]
GIREDLKVKGRLESPTLQVLFPDQRIDLFADRSAMLGEIRRAFGDVADDLARLLGRLDALDEAAGTFLATAGELPATGFFARRTAKAAAKKADAARTIAELDLFAELTPELVDLVLAPLPFLGFVDARREDDLPAARFARVITRFFRGLSRLEEGRSLRELFLDVAQRKGFEVRRAVVERVEPKGRALHLHIVGARDDLVTTELFVDASSDLSGVDAISHKAQPRDLALALQLAKPRGALHALAIEVDREVLPPALADHALLLNGRRDPTRFDASDPDAEDRPILLAKLPAEDDDRAVLVASYPLSVSRAHSELAELEAVLRARIERVVPFLSDGHPKLEALGARGSTLGVRPFVGHPLFATDLDPLAGITGIPMRTRAKNVLVAGPAVLPGLGVEGEYLVALQAADACAPLDPKRAPKNLAARRPGAR